MLSSIVCTLSCGLVASQQKLQICSLVPLKYIRRRLVFSSIVLIHQALLLELPSCPDIGPAVLLIAHSPFIVIHTYKQASSGGDSGSGTNRSSSLGHPRAGNQYFMCSVHNLPLLPPWVCLGAPMSRVTRPYLPFSTVATGRCSELQEVGSIRTGLRG